MSTALIRSALESRLQPWAAAKGIPVAWENVAFTPRAGQVYLRAFLIVAETESRDLAGSHRGYRGIWQINIISPTGEGAGPAEALAEEIGALYPPYERDLFPIPLLIVSPMSTREVPSDEFVMACWCRYRMDDWI